MAKGIEDGSNLPEEELLKQTAKEIAASTRLGTEGNIAILPAGSDNEQTMEIAEQIEKLFSANPTNVVIRQPLIGNSGSGDEAVSEYPKLTQLAERILSGIVTVAQEKRLKIIKEKYPYRLQLKPQIAHQSELSDEYADYAWLTDEKLRREIEETGVYGKAKVLAAEATILTAAGHPKFDFPELLPFAIVPYSNAAPDRYDFNYFPDYATGEVETIKKQKLLQGYLNMGFYSSFTPQYERRAPKRDTALPQRLPVNLIHLIPKDVYAAAQEEGVRADRMNLVFV